jgi:preprotein translocase subunit YajC
VSFDALMLQAVGPKAGTPGTTQDSSPSSGAPAQQGSGPGGGSSSLVMLAPIVVMMVVMLFMSRNQKKRDADTRAKLKKGSKVVSQSGLVGELVEMDERLAKVKIAPGTNVQMLVSSLSAFEETALAKTEDRQLKDLKDAKAVADKK